MIVPVTDVREVLLQAVVPWLHIRASRSRGGNKRLRRPGDWRLIEVLGVPVIVDLRVIDVLLLRRVQTRDVSEEKQGLNQRRRTL